MRITGCLLGIALGACGSSVAHREPYPMTYREHVAAARLASQRAAEHERVARQHGELDPYDYHCGDVVLYDQMTTGGKPLAVSTPCWDPEIETFRAHADAAQHQRAIAHDEATTASHQLEAELAACRNVPDREIDVSPFQHRSAILAVGRHYVGANVRGVRVVFRRLPGLTEQWLHDVIHCHQARFANQGDAPSYLPGDPTLIPGAKVTVSGQPTTITVTIEAPSADATRDVIARTNALLKPRMAMR